MLHHHQLLRVIAVLIIMPGGLHGKPRESTGLNSEILQTNVKTRCDHNTC